MNAFGQSLIAGVIAVGIAGGAIYEHSQINVAGDKVDMTNAAITVANQNKTQLIHKSKQRIKELPNMYEEIEHQAKAVINAQYTIAKYNVNPNNINFLHAKQQMKSLVNTSGSNFNPLDNQWVIPKNWKITPVYGAVGSDGVYPVAFYITDPKGAVLGVITSDYENKQFTNVNGYYTQAAQSQAQQYTAELKAKHDGNTPQNG